MALGATPPAGGAPPRGSAPVPCANKRRGNTDHDRLIGTRAGDRLLALAGNAILDGRAADERLFGGSGNDSVSARSHRGEIVDCGSGRDSATFDQLDRVRGCEGVRRI